MWNSLRWELVEHNRETPSLRRQQYMNLWDGISPERTHSLLRAAGPMFCGGHTRVAARATRSVIYVVVLAAWPPSLTGPPRKSASSLMCVN